MQELYHYNIEDFYRFTLSESELILERRPARGEEKTATERIPLEDVTACAHTELHLNRDGTPYPLIALTIRSAGFFDQEEGEQQIYPATPELVRDLDAHHVPIIDREKLQRAAPDLKSPKQVFSRTDGAGEYILILSLLLAGTGALTGLLWALAGPAAGVAALVCGIAARFFAWVATLYLCFFTWPRAVLAPSPVHPCSHKIIFSSLNVIYSSSNMSYM